MTFKQWIIQFINEDSPKGDLAVDVKGDKNFPNSKTYKKNRDYLDRVDTSDLCLQSFEEAWKEYKQEE
ncbi:YozE family protein [Lysinibacillus sp. NPDC096418]|uniref:YozE family protein n=1 Tax=Lysinibacillus sp. NPDC096418 TaxID=3364138 RepID=UPI0038093DF3